MLSWVRRPAAPPHLIGGALSVLAVLLMYSAAPRASAGASAPAASTYEQLSFAVLSDFDYEVPDPLDPASKVQSDQLPAKVRALNGKMVSIRGFMLPLDLDADGVSQFMLNASFDMCYFGAPVRMNEWILVKMKPGKKAKFSHLAFNVNGRLEVGEEIKNGRVLSLYRLEADSADISQ
jgi:hypothetical protein